MIFSRIFKIMMSAKPCVLAINGGSSSLKFALFTLSTTIKTVWRGQIDGLGKGKPTGYILYDISTEQVSIDESVRDITDADGFFNGWLPHQPEFSAIVAIGHRFVHGMQRSEPARVDAALLNELKKISWLDPEHLPGELKLVGLVQRMLPDIPQFICFDTAFHRSMPGYARMLPLPQSLRDKGLERYGFHGLSYHYLIQELRRLEPQEKAAGRVIMAHLGSGASLAAIRNGKSIDTSMGFTPASGVPMGTRTGDLDPGVSLFLMEEEHLTSAQYSDLVNHESGLLGMSGKSGDMRILLDMAATDAAASEAIDVFCYQVKKWIGAYAAALGGIDILVFSGGIGEHAPKIRAQICSGLDFLGIAIDPEKNAANEAVISSGKTTVRVIPTNEELMIARLVSELMNFSSNK